MMQFIHILLFIIILLFSPAVGLSQQRFPPPDFESGYTQPLMTEPATRAFIFEYLDVLVLLAAMSLGTYLVLKKRSRRAIFCLMVFCLIYFGFWRQGCVCPIGAVQNVALALFDYDYAIPFTVIIFFILPLVFTLFFGRTFCGAVCPLGAIQDLVLISPVSLPVWLDRALGLLAYIYLGAAVLFAATGSAFIICQYDPFVSFFRISGSLNMLILGGCFLLTGMFVGRPYCRFLCPYGAILRVFSRFSQRRVTITPAECVQCRLCSDSCPFGAIDQPQTAPAPGNYRGGKITLVILLILLPVIVFGFGWFGTRLAGPFSRMHATVRLADRMYLEETGKVPDTTDASDAYRAMGMPLEELYHEAFLIGDGFNTGTMIFGGFVGLVVWCMLIGLVVRRTRTDYEADRGRCLACGRCYEYCPVEINQRKKRGVL